LTCVYFVFVFSSAFCLQSLPRPLCSLIRPSPFWASCSTCPAVDLFSSDPPHLYLPPFFATFVCFVGAISPWWILGWQNPLVLHRWFVFCCVSCPRPLYVFFRGPPGIRTKPFLGEARTPSRSTLLHRVPRWPSASRIFFYPCC